MMSKTESKKPEGNPTAIAKRVADILSIQEVEAAFQLYPVADRTDGTTVTPFNGLEVVLAIQEGATVQIELRFTFEVIADAKADSTNAEEVGEKITVFKAQSRFAASYRLDDDASASDEDLQAFAHVNGPLNLVPFWRESVSSSLSRAGMPPYNVPVFNPYRIAQQITAQQSAGENEKPDDM